MSEQKKQTKIWTMFHAIEEAKKEHAHKKASEKYDDEFIQYITEPRSYHVWDHGSKPYVKWKIEWHRLNGWNQQMAEVIKDLYEELQAQKEELQALRFLTRKKVMGELLGDCFELYRQKEKESNNEN